MTGDKSAIPAGMRTPMSGEAGWGMQELTENVKKRWEENIVPGLGACGSGRVGHQDA